ncbi:ATP-binding protein [Vulcanisaeta thermophila]|uniref:ATP-binding protein n=1 Tax=Vulcanisaeta thermophila TaxID=867917 RepID=UPI000852D514|nr:ATP-binding protein [Vulcanisaeta thermophila]
MANEIGYLVNVESPLVYAISIKREARVTRYDYVYVPIRDYVDGKEINTKVLGQILWIRREPYRVGTDGYVPEVLEGIPSESLVEVVQGRVLVLGYKLGDKIIMPRTAPPIGTPVYLADESMVREFIKVPEERALCIGSLATRSGVPFCIDMNGLRRHMAIIAATGSGKTWSSVVLIEELLKKGATVLVFDPHGEYTHIKDSIHKLGPEYVGRVTIIRVADYNVGDYKYRINLTKVNPEVLADIMGIPQKAYKIRYALYLLHKLIKLLVKHTGKRELGTIRNMIWVINEFLNNGGNVKIDRLLKKYGATLDEEARAKVTGVMEELGEIIDTKSKMSVLINVRTHLRRLARLNLYTYKSLPLNKILRQSSVTIVNLAGVSDEIQDHVVYHILTRVFRARVNFVRNLPGPRYPFPVVVILEEAHRFAPPRSTRKTLSLSIISRIAAEGRKFGVYLVVITQRPSRVDPDILSQCNSQLILRLINQRDIQATLSASEALSQELSQLIPVLDTGEGVVTGPITPLPMVIKLRNRVLDYGGSDIDLVTAWRVDGMPINEVRNAVNNVLNANVTVQEALEGIAMMGSTDSLEYGFGVLRGRVANVNVEVRVKERSWYCEACGARERPCPHVIALLAKAIKENIISIK